MNILFIGDIFASAGRRVVAEHLRQLVTEERIDLVIANVENAAGGFGVTVPIAQELFSVGVEVMTTGNHVWDKREIYDFLDREPRLLRPANYDASLPGKGLYIATARNGVSYAVMNLQGRVHLPPLECPFKKADELLKQVPDDVKVRFVDFHAEVTSEKMALAWYLDGRVSAVIGTHTHVPTADARVLEKGTAFQTDCGMTGPYESVIGVEKEMIIKRFLTQLPMRFEAAKGDPQLRAVVVAVDEETGRSTAIKPVAIIGGRRVA
ncbi:MAG: TIGR00282 family metallophosphoesterase [Bryobacteraceae bacterium]|nr:TIGR00282 family metallophosphoesterase [Bryobacteraceae bacterium]